MTQPTKTTDHSTQQPSFTIQRETKHKDSKWKYQKQEVTNPKSVSHVTAQKTKNFTKELAIWGHCLATFPAGMARGPIYVPVWSVVLQWNCCNLSASCDILLFYLDPASLLCHVLHDRAANMCSLTKLAAQRQQELCSGNNWTDASNISQTTHDNWLIRPPKLLKQTACHL